VCLKIVGCGGITRLWAAAERARAAGSEVYVASTYDGPVGIAAGLHAAAALGPDLPACGLATLALFDGIDDPFPARDGRIAVPPGPGLGISWPVG
jgi:L-alanine-DL-glutamate epimerase-like enolase superfamily enzyme